MRVRSIHSTSQKKSILSPFKDGVVKKLLMSQHFNKISEVFIFTLFCLLCTCLR
jgi:hypothetical protein